MDNVLTVNAVVLVLGEPRLGECREVLLRGD